MLFSTKQIIIILFQTQNAQYQLLIANFYIRNLSTQCSSILFSLSKFAIQKNIYLFLSKYTILKFSIDNSLRDVPIREKLQRQIYIVNNLKINILIESNILDSQKMHLDYKYKQLVIENCKEIAVSITITFVKNKINKIVKTFTALTILLKSSTMVPVRLRNNTQLLSDRDFMFVFYQQIFNRFGFDDEIHFYVINVNFSIIQINNILDQSIKIDKNSCLESLQKYKKKSYYIAISKYFYLAVDSSIFLELQIKKAFKLDITVLTAFASILFDSILSKNISLIATKVLLLLSINIFFAMRAKSILIDSISNIIEILSTFQSSIENINVDNVIFYNTTKAVRKQFIAIAKVFSLLQQNTKRTINLSKQKQISIILKSKIKIDATKVYLLDSADKEFLDQKFNKLYNQERMQFITQSTEFDWSIFVI